MTRCLRFDQFAATKPYHAAFVGENRGGIRIDRHDHDFAELMLILDGEGDHWLNGTSHRLTPGQIWSIRPEDIHSLRAKPGSGLAYVNVAFREESLKEFLTLSGVAAIPPLRTVDGDGLSRISRAGMAMAEAYSRDPSPLDLVEFLTRVCRASSGAGSSQDLPHWLGQALAQMRSEENLAAGLPRLLELCSVSDAHLSRTVRQHLGVRPTDLVNEIRVEHAKVLLATTPLDAETIAFRCGWQNASYFYRLFRGVCGKTPRDFRKGLRMDGDG